MDLHAIRLAIDPKAPPKGYIRCPVHDDERPSLSICLSDDGKLLVRCKAGCDQGAVFTEALRRASHLLSDTRGNQRSARKTTYTYNDADGTAIARIIRTDRADGGKDFLQQTPDGNGGWKWKGPNGATPLYRLDEIATDPGAIIVVCEGEKAAEAAQRQLGDSYVATSWMMGADNVTRADFTPLRGRDVIVWPDNDPPGAKAAATVASKLHGVAQSVKLVRVDDLPPKADAADVIWNADELLSRAGPIDTSTAAADAATEPSARARARMVSSGAAASDAEAVAELPEALDLVALSRIEPQPPSFAIDRWLPHGHVTLFSGHGGVGKSQIALYAAVCIALGRPFFGVPTERSRVVFLSYEDRTDELHRRLNRLCAWLGVPMESLAGHLFVYDWTEVSDVMFTETRDGPSTTSVYAGAAAFFQRADARVLMIDGVSDVFAANENDRAAVKAFVRSLRRITGKEGALLLIGHVNRSTANGAQQGEAYSGSTGWHNGARSRWALQPEAADGERTGVVVLELQKANYAEAGEVIRLSWNGEARLYVAEASTPVTPLTAALRGADEREAVLDLIRAAEAAGDPIPTATRGERTAHVVAEARGLPPGLRGGKRARTRFYAHLEALRVAGAVRIDSILRPNRHYSEVYRASALATEHAPAMEHPSPDTERDAPAMEH